MSTLDAMRKTMGVTAKAPRLTVRNQPIATGLARITQSPRGYDIWFGGKCVGSVSANSSGWHTYDGWYWCTPSEPDLGIEYMNTHITRTSTKEAARDACLAYVRACLVVKGLIKLKRKKL